MAQTMDALVEMAQVPDISHEISLRAYYNSALKLFERGTETADNTSRYVLRRRFVNLRLQMAKHSEWQTWKSAHQDNVKRLDEFAAKALEEVENLHAKLLVEFKNYANASSMTAIAVKSSDSGENGANSTFDGDAAATTAAAAASSSPSSLTSAHTATVFESTNDKPTTGQHNENKQTEKHFAESHPLHRTLKDFEELQVLGEGAFGVVRKARDVKTNTICVLKFIPYTSSADVLRISSELQMLRTLGEHPYIVRYVSTFLVNDDGVAVDDVDDGNVRVKASAPTADAAIDDGKPRVRGKFAIAMEYCFDGDLEQYVDALSSETYISSAQLRAWATQLCDALRFVHEKNVIHRDLKPSNVFLTTDDSGETVVRLGDFGLATRLLLSQAKASRRAGTIVYWPPECIEGESPDKAADVWAVGAILVNVAIKKHPSGLLIAEKRRALIGEVRERYGALLANVCAAATLRKPQQRPTMDTLYHALVEDDAVSLRELLESHGE